jgi:hypothetical protein
MPACAVTSFISSLTLRARTSSSPQKQQELLIFGGEAADVFAPRETLLCIEQPDELGHIDLSVTDQPSQQDRLQVSASWNGQRQTGWIMQMPQAKMTAALTHDLVAETLERAYRLLSGNDGQARAHRVMTMLQARTPVGSGRGCP